MELSNDLLLANQKLYTIVMITKTKEKQQEASKAFKKSPILSINTHFSMFFRTLA
jgi:hypothetical protein